MSARKSAPAEARRIIRRVAEILTVSGGVNVHGARDLALREIAPGFLETNSFGAVVAELSHYAIHEAIGSDPAPDGIHSWNVVAYSDAPGRTQAEVLAMLAAAETLVRDTPGNEWEARSGWFPALATA